jgi:uncharacterized protein YwgA
MDYVIGILIKELRAKNESAGKIQLQKLIYFLKYLGVKIPYGYVVAKYGPYSSELSKKLNEMEFNDYIKSIHNYNYEISSQNFEEKFYSLESDSKYNNVITQFNRVFNVLPSLEFDDIELYSTVHYCYNSLKVVKDSVSIEEVTQEVKKWKDDKFSDEEIKNAFDKLSTNNLLVKN